MRIRHSLKTSLVLAAILLFINCGHSNDSAKKYKLAFLTNNASDFWTIARHGCEQAEKELSDVSVEFRIPSDGSVEEQHRIVDDMMTRGISGLAISPNSPDNQTAFLNDLAQRIVVITQDSDAPASNRACYIGTDNKAAGRQAGQLIKEALPNGGKIMVFVGKLDAQNAKDRFEGIKETLAGSNIEIIDVKTDDTDQGRAKANASDTLVKYPTISALIGLWAYNGPAILSAIKDANKVGQVKIVCFDEDDQTLAGIKEGSIYGTVVQQPYEFGYQSVHLMSKILHGDKSQIPPGKQIFVPTQMIKKDNVDDFIVKINKLKGRS